MSAISFRSCSRLAVGFLQRIKREHGQDERGASSGSTWDQYELREYEVDPTDLSAETVAAKIGLPPEQVFKTLAVQGDRNRIYLAVVPGNEELDSKALAHHTGDRKVDMVPLKDVQDATGYIRGGVTALACKRDYQVYIDESAEIYDVISVSAG